MFNLIRQFNNIYDSNEVIEEEDNKRNKHNNNLISTYRKEENSKEDKKMQSVKGSQPSSQQQQPVEEENLFDEEVQRFDADSYRQKYGDRWKKYASMVRDVVQPDGTIIREYVIEDPTVLEQLSDEDEDENSAGGGVYQQVKSEPKSTKSLATGAAAAPNNFRQAVLLTLFIIKFYSLFRAKNRFFH